MQIDFYFRTQSKFSIYYLFLVFLFDFILPTVTSFEFFRCQLLTVVVTLFGKSSFNVHPIFPSARVILFFFLFCSFFEEIKNKMVLEMTNYSTNFSFGCKSLKIVIIILLLTKAS